jgi:sialic acid synthase SpsE
MEIRVRDRLIGGRGRVFIIAELGTNHNGSESLALKMIKEAARCGVDAVKLQLVNADESYVRECRSYDIFKKISLSFDSLKRLKSAAERAGLIFFATAGDISSLKLLLRLKAPLIKISSGCMTNSILLREAALTGLPIIISTGMSYLEEVREAVSELEENGAGEMALLHCVSAYPCRGNEVNLNAIRALRSAFRYPVGYSDHTEGNLAPWAAAAVGAKVLEKHFTVDRRLKGPDQRFSAGPREMKELVDGVRSIEEMLGKDLKRPAGREKDLRNRLRRFLVYAKDLAKGSILCEEDIGIKRLNRGVGMPAGRYSEIVGMRTTRKVKRDQPITPVSVKKVV